MAQNVPVENRDTRAVESATAHGVEDLCEWASGVKLDDLPETVRQRAALVIADNLAAVIAARNEPEVELLQEQLLSGGTTCEATVFRGGGPRTDRYSAAVANGAAADWCELDEGYRKAPCHGGLCVLPALWAEAEAEGRTVRELLRALVIGYEVVTRFARSFPFPDMTLHPHATLPAIGAAAGLAAVRQLPAETFLYAVTGASTMIAPGPFNHALKGALIRNVWAGTGAWVGLRCVDWSQFGIGGVAASPYDVFVVGLGTEARPSELTADLGRSWGIADGYHKIYACCQYSHSAVEALETLLARRPDVVAVRDVERIIVETHWRGLTLDNPRPGTSLAAKFSLPHIIATTSHLRHAGAEAFSATTLDNPAIAGLRERVELRRYEPECPWPEDRPARVIWILRTGERLEAECRSARGGPDRPFTSSEILNKVRKLTTPVYPNLPNICQDLVGLDGNLLASTWTDVVAKLTVGALS